MKKLAAVLWQRGQRMDERALRIMDDLAARDLDISIVVAVDKNGMFHSLFYNERGLVGMTHPPVKSVGLIERLGGRAFHEIFAVAPTDKP